MPGPPPKPARLRQRRNRKAGAALLVAVRPAKARTSTAGAPPIPNPDGREWHPLTLVSWKRAWCSEMASQWLPTDGDGLGRLALLWDAFYKQPAPQIMAEIRLQEQRFGLSPLDRSRLQWEVSRAEWAEQKRPRPARRTGISDPRSMLTVVR
jgi:hypothetical protein